jgi:hypothetical protein
LHFAFEQHPIAFVAATVARALRARFSVGAFLMCFLSGQIIWEGHSVTGQGAFA